MFKKKKCKNCGKKIDKNYNFCPYCRTPLDNSNDEDMGLLGKNDFTPNDELRLPIGLNTLFNSLLKNLNKQFLDLEKANANKQKKVKKNGIGIHIYTSGNKPPKIRVTSFGNTPQIKEQKKQVVKKRKLLKLPSANLRKFVGLPKKEPKTKIRRLSNKVIYEIEMPGVKSIDEISIIQLENSIEIKALAKKGIFYKIIPLNLPIKDYDFSKGKLVLELGSEE